jgi:hypothetical protein
VVVHAYNTSYLKSGGRRIAQHLRPAQMKLGRLISKTKEKPKGLGAQLKW